MKRARIACVLPGLAAALLGLAWCPSAQAEPERQGADTAVAQSERLAADAFKAYGDKDYASAVALYRQAFDLVPDADLLYNIARIYDVGIRDRPLALTFYRRYVADPGAVPERIAKANRRIEELKAAEQAMAEAPARAAAPGAVAGRGVAPASVSDTPSSSWSTSRSAALVTGIVGLASIGVGTGYGLSALSQADIAHGECDGNQCRSQRGVDAARAAARQATVATLGVSVGGALLATGAVLWLLNPGSSGAHDADGKVQLAPLASATELGVQLAGGF